MVPIYLDIKILFSMTNSSTVSLWPDRAGTAVRQWAVEHPDWKLAPMEALGRLTETALVVGRDHVAPLLEKHGLQSGEFDVLAALRRSGKPFELTPTALLGVTMLSSGGMTARLDRLERLGHVERRPNPDDRRGTLVRLTRAGRRLIDRVVPLHLANQARLAACLDPDELATLSALLGKLLRHVDGQGSPDGS